MFIKSNIEIKNTNQIFNEIARNIEDLNSISYVFFKFPMFKPLPSLIYELSKPIQSLYDLNIKLLQFGLLIDSIPKKNIDDFFKNKLKLNSKNLKNKYQKIISRRITKINEVNFFRDLFNIHDKKIVLIETRNFSTIDSLELLFTEEIENFDIEIIKKLRLLRSFRNISELAHSVDPNFTQEKFNKLGFLHPLLETNLDSFWKVFLNHFLDILLRMKSSIQSQLAKLWNEEILIFNSVFEKSKFKKYDENRIIFEFENKRDSVIYLHAYKLNFLYEDKMLIPFNWHIYGDIIKPLSKHSKKWGKVKPYNAYSIKNEGNWKLLSSIQYKFEDEISIRVIDHISKFSVI